MASLDQGQGRPASLRLRALSRLAMNSRNARPRAGATAAGPAGSGRKTARATLRFFRGGGGGAKASTTASAFLAAQKSCCSFARFDCMSGDGGPTKRCLKGRGFLRRFCMAVRAAPGTMRVRRLRMPMVFVRRSRQCRTLPNTAHEAALS